MKKSALFVLITILFFNKVSSQEYQLWTTLNFEGDTYEFYTLSTNNYLNQSLTLSLSGYEVYNDVSEITAKKNGIYIQDPELIKILAVKAEQILYSNARPDFLTQEWIEEVDIFHYSNDDIPGGVWMPTGSYDGNYDPQFYNYIVNHAITGCFGCTTSGLDNYEHRVSIYRNIIFITFYPESTDLDEFTNNFNANYLSMFNNAINATNDQFAIGGAIENVSGAIQHFCQVALDELNAIPLQNIDKIPNFNHFKNAVTTTHQILSDMSTIINITGIATSIFENSMRAYMIKMYAEAEAELRIEAWEKFIVMNASIDPAIIDGFDEAKDEYREYTEEPLYKEIILDILNDTEFWKPTISLSISTIKTIIAGNASLAALPTAGLIIGGAFIVVPILYETWDILHDGDKLLESVVCAATLEKLTVAGMPGTPINNVDDMGYVSIMSNIRQSLAFLFYANFSDRLDLFGGSFKARLEGGNSNYQAYEQHMLQQRELRYSFFTTYRPDLFPITGTMNNFIADHSSVQNQLLANFTASTTTIIETQSIDFTDNSTGTPTSYQWTFEGGTPATSDLQNPVVTYYTAGTFDVTLTVSDGINTSDPLTKPDYITVQNSVTGGLVAYYPFNGNANDESGNGNNGSIDGATPTTDRFGNANCAFNFDGSNDQIVVSPQQILKDFPAGNHTYSVWINPSSSPSNVKMVIDCAGWGSGGDQRGIRFHGRPTPIFKWVTNVSSYMTESTIGLTTNNWCHIVGVLEGNTGRIYVNGALTGTATSSGQPTGITYFKIGNVSVGGTGDLYYHGKIDDIMLFNRALSASEISSLYNQSTPCPGTPTVTYEGQVYNTVKIGNQCWIRENLNVGTKIPGTTNQSNNQLIEKYCYNNDLANCASYGGLYQWDEMMQYSSQEGTQGICPTGWHIPSDQEWCTLTTFIDPTVSCNSTNWTGTNVGFKMKSTNGWISNGNGSDIFGFTAVPNGDRDAGGGFSSLGMTGTYWTSTEISANAWRLSFNYAHNDILRHNYYKTSGISVRCLKNEYSPIITITIPNSTTIWQSGYTNSISCTDNISENVKIDLFKNNSLLSNIAYSTFSDGSYDWPIPSGTVAGSDYQIKITSISNSSVYDLSDYFTISTPILTVNSPSGSENWLMGNSYNITWDFNITENVKIRLYKSGDLINTIKSSTECDGEYNWLVPVDLLPGDDYKVKISSVTNSSIYDYSSTFNIFENQLTLNLKAYLEGPFNGTDMITSLNGGGLIPLIQPYNIPPWNYSGTESVVEIPNLNVVDWVLVELRDAEDAGSANEGTRISQQAAFILNDGSIVGLDGFSKLTFATSFSHNLFVIIRHRNHLGLMTALPLNKIDGIYTYDFTGGSDIIYGGINGTKQLAPGKWGMFSGDGDANNTIELFDKTGVWSPNAGKMGYLSGDFNLDGQVDNRDKNEFWLPNLGKGSQVPQ